MSIAVDFLRKFYPNGMWVLTAIMPDSTPTKIHTRTFTPDRVDLLEDWLNVVNGTQNVYFHVNQPIRSLSKKALRGDIKSVNYFHVDIDPEPGKDIAEEQERALNLLKNPPSDVPKPSCIVFSGGGYQGFWKLDEPIHIGGDMIKAEDVKRFNMQLESVFSADNCHNIDRIMRLPGTTNIPDKKKRAKGRLSTQATLVEWHEDRVYDVEEFLQAPIVQSESDGFGGDTVEISGNVKRLDSVEDLPSQVSNHTKVLIVQGSDPNNPDKHPSRSEWVFEVCCALVKEGVEDEMIYSVITDPDFDISESILEKGNSAQRYATRQIERAKEFAVDPQLMSLNDKHAVISDVGGKCLIISEIYDQVMKRNKISRQSFGDFSNRYMNISVKIGEDKNNNPKYMPLGKWWLNHAERRQYDTIVFDPERTIHGAYNLWKGFNCHMKEGDCGLYLQHIRDNICGGNNTYYDYIVGWMAQAVQHPGQQGESAIVLRGRMGTGKSMFAKEFGSIWGKHFLQISNPKHLTGSFNAHLRDCVVVFGDEAFYANDKEHERILKTMVTEDMLMYEPKGVDVEPGPNFTHIILASDGDWVIPAGADDRRFFVLDVSDEQMQNREYFKALRHQMDNGGKEALLHMLMTYDLSDYDVRAIPKTKALIHQKELSFSQDEEWWYNKLQQGEILADIPNWDSDILRDDLLSDYAQYMDRFKINDRSNATKIGKFLKKVCPTGYPQGKQMSPQLIRLPNGKETMKRPYCYVFPTLQECRDHWDESKGGPFEWNPIINSETEDEPAF